MAKKFDPAWLERHRVTLAPVERDEIVGVTHVMGEIASVLARLSDAEGAQALGATLPRGILFHGPAGTGKTLVARFVAGTIGSDVPMYEISSDELTPQILRGMLRHLAAEHPRSVVYWDEIDQWGISRDAAPYHSPSTRLVLVAALSALDGLVPAAGPIIIASSNRPPSELDAALVRAGRLGIHVAFDLPDERERLELFARFLAGRPTDADVDLVRLARLSRDASPAAIRGLVDDAAGLALARGARSIGAVDLVAAIRRDGEIGPEEEVADPERRRRASVHEAGHVACAVRLRGPAHLYAVRLSARGGRTETGADRADRSHAGDDLLRDALVIGMGGLAAELAILGEASLSAAGDVEGATDIALGRLVAGLDPSFPPVSLETLRPHVADSLKDAAAAELSGTLEAARDRAAAIVAEALPAIRVFAEALDAAGELVGDDLAAALEAAGFPGPEAAA